MRSSLSSLLVLGLLGCGTARTSAVAETPTTQSSEALPFIENDYPRALALAKTQGVPLFIDAGAPWCHTCRSMNAYVFTDKALARQAPRFVWLQINTDLPGNAAFMEKYAMEIWPTFFIVEPREEKTLLRFAGSATVPQLEKILDDGERAFHGGVQGPEALLARGDALYGEGKAAESADVLSQAMTEAPADWSRRGRALESLLTAQYGARRYDACMRTALEQLPRVPHSASWANSVVLGLSCGLKVPAQTPGAPEQMAALEARGHEALAPDISMPADDRSGVYEVLVEAREQARDSAGAKALAAQWLTFLEGEAARAPTPEARTVFDSHRMGAAMILGEPQRAVPAIEQSERDLPDDYNPPARLANLYRQMGRLDDALAASTRALTKVQGGRRLRVLSERSAIYVARGEKDQAARTLEEAIAYSKTLSAAQAPPTTVAALEKKLEDLKAK